MHVHSLDVSTPLPDLTNQGWGWLLFMLLHIIDLIMRKIGRLIQKGLSYRYTLSVLGFLATIGAAFCSMDTMRKSNYMIICISVLSVGDFTALYLQRQVNDQFLGFKERARIYFRASLFILKAGGMILVLAGFVYLTALVEEHQDKDWYSIGFFSFVFLNVTAIMKIVRVEDLGLADSIMALSVYLFIKFPETIEDFRTVMWAIVVLLEMLKVSKVRPREIKELVLPIQAHFNSSTSPKLAWKIELRGHQKDIVGICVPKNSDNLFSASRDGILQIFRIPSFSLLRSQDFRGEIGCLFTTESLVFVGLRNGIQIYHDESNQSFLTKPLTNDENDSLGLVTALVFANELLFSGTIYGSIVFWRQDGTTPSGLSYLGSLPAAQSRVTCLASKEMTVFSAYGDGLIKVWSLPSLICTASLTPHTDAVTSLLIWDKFLFSCSLDGTIMAFVNEGRRWIYDKSHTERNSLHALWGFRDFDNRPVILCSAQNGIANVYDRDTFGLRGSILSTSTIDTWTATRGFLFSGGRDGKLHAWTVL